jgi:hypothetical protein
VVVVQSLSIAPPLRRFVAMAPVGLLRDSTVGAPAEKSCLVSKGLGSRENLALKKKTLSKRKKSARYKGVRVRSVIGCSCRCVCRFLCYKHWFHQKTCLEDHSVRREERQSWRSGRSCAWHSRYAHLWWIYSLIENIPAIQSVSWILGWVHSSVSAMSLGYLPVMCRAMLWWKDVSSCSISSVMTHVSEPYRSTVWIVAL